MVSIFVNYRLGQVDSVTDVDQPTSKLALGIVRSVRILGRMYVQTLLPVGKDSISNAARDKWFDIRWG